MPDWVGPEAQVRARLGGKDTTAQVDPGAFTRAMIKAAMANGAALRIGYRGGLVLAGDGRRSAAPSSTASTHRPMPS